MPRDDDLAVLLTSLDERDVERAAGYILDHHVPRVRWILRNIMEVPDHLVDGMISDGMVAAWTNRHLFDSAKGTFRAWFTRVSINAARDTLRRIRRENDAIRGYAVDCAAAQPIRPDEDGPVSERFRGFRGAFESLPEEDRRILQAQADADGTPWADEVASEMGRTPGAIRARANRAAGKLREQFDNLE